MAWVFRECRHLTPNAALLVILCAVLWLPISFGAATAMHAVLFAKVASWPAWMQLLHPLATVIAKSKLLVLPVYPAAWPHAKKHPFVQLVFKGYETIKCLSVIRKVGLRYRQAEIVSFIGVSPLRARLCRHKKGTAYDKFPISGRTIVAVWEETSVAKSLEKSLDVYS
jgi:hypothetical protein